MNFTKNQWNINNLQSKWNISYKPKLVIKQTEKTIDNVGSNIY